MAINQQGTTDACRQTAFDLAERFGVRLEALHLCAAPWLRAELTPFYPQELIDFGRQQVSLEQGEARKWFNQTSQAHPKVATDFLTLEDLVTPIVARRARVADLSVVPSIGAKDDVFWAAVRDGVFHSGRPVLVVPEEPRSNFGETVVVAWKDGVEAVRAVTAAAPFFAKAKRICLLTIDEGNHDDQSMAAMTDYLTLAGLKVESSKIVPKSDNVGEALLHETASQTGALLVMGAYGHWRWREWAFGGVTQYVLRNITVPVLMVH